MKRRLVALFIILVCVMAGACGTKNSEGSASENSHHQTEQDANKQEDGAQTGKEPGAEQGTTSQSMENPVSVTFEYVDKDLENGSGEMVFYASCTKPVVTVLGNQEASDKISQHFEQYAAEFEGWVEDYRRDAEDFYANTQGQSSYYWHIDISLGRGDAGIVSFVGTDNTYLGGAHGSHYSYGVNFDTQTGELLKLENLSDDPAGFYQMVKSSVIEQCKEYPDQEAFYHPTDSEDFAILIDDVLSSDSWYFTKEGLKIVASPYFIGPYAAGEFTFIIPYEELEGLLDKYAYTGAFFKSVAYMDDCQIDLNGDGQKDTIRTDISVDEYATITKISFEINDGLAGVSIDNNYTGEDKAFLEYPLEYYYIVDLDKDDPYLEIAVCDYGMNDYNATYFYRYDGSKLLYMGWIPNVLEDSQVEVYGNGMIKGTMRMEIVETVRSRVAYQLNGQKISLIEQEWYEPDYNSYPAQYLTHDVLRDVTVYADKDVKSAKIVLKAGEKDVRFLATDNEEWVKLQTANGKICYMHMAQPIIIDSDGQELIVPEVFEDILLAG